ncbi:hypothetical protein CO046_04370 [Candidatus Peregrinibacteria bacterium CG_4_9_14_0_2_um_filter_53_11]|nr:MAG: hypothetical protein CO046_04370 [Candidatus Peregrinibacteria bacterium CG_4_9_14_0_2_um_filter_53_11]
MKRFEIALGLLRIPFDLIFVLGAFLAAYYLRAEEAWLPDFFKRPDLLSFPSFDAYVSLALWGGGLFLIIVAFLGGYSLKTRTTTGREISKILFASLLWLMAVITYYFVIRAFPFSRLVLFLTTAFIAIFTIVGRGVIRLIQELFLAHGIGKRRIVFVGSDSIVDYLEKMLLATGAVTIMGRVKGLGELEEFLKKHPTVEEVIQTRAERTETESLLALCRERHLEFHFVPDVLEVQQSNIEISPVGRIPLISLRKTPLDGWGKVVKRIFDIFASLLGLVILSPFLLVVALIIKVDSAGTVLFRYLDDGTPATRVGERGRRFSFLKFRTMKAGTHSMRYGELASNDVRKDSPLVKIKNDPRITRVGRFLRRTSIDELPQLWNVLVGEMSLVGPRPHLPEEVEKYQRKQKFVLSIKPGITGLAQISGRSDLPFDEEVRLDTFYIENWSLWLDIKILVKTVFVLLRPYKE